MSVHTFIFETTKGTSTRFLILHDTNIREKFENRANPESQCLLFVITNYLGVTFEMLELKKKLRTIRQYVRSKATI